MNHRGHALTAEAQRYWSRSERPAASLSTSKEIYCRLMISVFSLLLLISFLMSSDRVGHYRAELPLFIAHAMGGIEGQTYTNSLEAWRLNYQYGYRFFEVDLYITSDQHLVAFHPGQEESMGLQKGFTYSEFVKTKIAGKYTPLDANKIADLMIEKADWFLITDTKSDLQQSLELLCRALSNKGIDCTKRVIPQIYDPEQDLEIVNAMKFPKLIFTLYRIWLTDEEVVKVVRTHQNIVAVTMSESRWSEKLVTELKKLGVRSFVHTINGCEKIKRYLDKDVGVYTDFGCNRSFIRDSK